MAKIVVGSIKITVLRWEDITAKEDPLKALGDTVDPYRNAAVAT